MLGVGVLIQLFLSKIHTFLSYLYGFYKPLVLILLFSVNSQMYLLSYLLINIS